MSRQTCSKKSMFSSMLLFYVVQKAPDLPSDLALQLYYARAQWMAAESFFPQVRGMHDLAAFRRSCNINFLCVLTGIVETWRRKKNAASSSIM